MKYVSALARNIRARLGFAAKAQPPFEPSDGRVEQVAIENTADFSDGDGVSLLDLQPFTTLRVRTRNSLYQMRVVHGSDVIVQGGRSFPIAKEGYVIGSRFVGSSIKRAWIGVGMQMNIFSDCRWLMTSPVETITIDSERATLH